MTLTDAQILDFLEESIKERSRDNRWPPSNYMCHIGTFSASLCAKETRSFREIVTEAVVGRVTTRLLG